MVSPLTITSMARNISPKENETGLSDHLQTAIFWLVPYVSALQKGVQRNEMRFEAMGTTDFRSNKALIIISPWVLKGNIKIKGHSKH